MSRETVDPNSLYGLYCRCVRNPEQIRANGLDEFFGLVQETLSGLTETERRRFLKYADGKRPRAIAEEEGCRPQAVVQSVKAMIRKSPYCEIAARHGCLRRRKNQFEYMDTVDTRYLHPEDALADDGCPNFPEQPLF